ncbi:MAG: hypothetical protein ACE5JX_09355 [Acidobacteriota bacterium]
MRARQLMENGGQEMGSTAGGSEFTNRRVRRDRILLTLLVAVLALPFLFQPFHIDDRIYLEVADNALKHPFFPYDYPPLFEGLASQDAASHSHLPLTSYYLALLKLVAASYPEWLCHLAFLIFPLVVALSFYDLSRRYVRYPLAAACVLVLSPGVLVLGHTLMTEVPLLAFWMLALSRFLRISDGTAGGSDWALCALGLLAASFISLLTGGLLLLLAAALLGRRLGWRAGRPAQVPYGRAALLLALPLLLWLLWYSRAYFHYDRLVLVRTVLHLDKRAAFSALLLAKKLLSFGLNLGGAVLFPLALWCGFAGRASSLIFLLVFIFSFAGLGWGLESWNLVQAFLFSAFLSSGGMALFGLYKELAARFRRAGPGSAPRSGPARNGLALLFLWFCGILLSSVLLYPSGSVRYALLATPVLILVWILAMERRVKNAYFRRNLVWLSVGLTMLYSLPLSYADYRFAEMYRDAARAITSDYAKSGRTIWFTAEWGFRHYLEEAGAAPLPRISTAPESGDILVKPYVAFPWVTLYDSDRYLRLLEQREAKMTFPIRILDFRSHAGFYSTAWGPLPFSLAGKQRWEWFNIFEVKKRYQGPIPPPERHW